MKLSEAINNIKEISILDNIEVAWTIARKFKMLAPDLIINNKGGSQFEIRIIPFNDLNIDIRDEIRDAGRYVYFKIDENGAGMIASSHPHFLYSFACYIIDTQFNSNVEEFACGKMIVPSFEWLRITYDYFLTQEGRIQKGLNRKNYVERMAKYGFTHMEINGLAFRNAMENGPKGEIGRAHV